MKNFWLLIPIYFLSLLSTTDAACEEKSIKFQAAALPLNKEAERIGINLGQWTQHGTAQFSSNLLMNPGFEGNVDRHIAIATVSDSHSFYDESDRVFRDSFWDGATFEIRTGPFAGVSGRIAKSIWSDKTKTPQYFTESPLPGLDAQTVISLSKSQSCIDNWLAVNAGTTHADPSQARPGSAGTQSLKLQPSTEKKAELSSFLDQDARIAGKAVLVEGNWVCTFWAKGEGDQPRLQLFFRRINEASKFFDETVHLTNEWKQYTIAFNAVDSGTAGTLQFSLSAPDIDSSVWVDDVWLGKADHQPSFFRPQLVHILRSLKPSYIRECFHAGDTFENRIGTPESRKSLTLRTAGSESKTWSYSLGEFLDLAEEVGANPWVIIPLPFTDEENLQLGKYLADHAGSRRFSKVIVEFGNENWSRAYKPSGIPYPNLYGEAADRAFDYIRRGSDHAQNLTYVINGQYSNPELTQQIMAHVKTADGIAIAPYFFPRLDSNLSEATQLQLLFGGDSRNLKKISDRAKDYHLETLVYGINLHTADGSAAEEERNRVVAGMISGSALAKRLLVNLKYGYHPLLVHNLAQFRVKTYTSKGFVRLWGVTRNMQTPPHLRPTALAMQMLNQAIGGNMEAFISNKADKLTAAGFKRPDAWTAAIISENPQPVTVNIEFPDDEHPLPDTCLVLTAPSPFDSNETRENVTIEQAVLQAKQRTVQASIPAYGLIVLHAVNPVAGKPKHKARHEGIRTLEQKQKKLLEELKNFQSTKVK